jgi:hypothetical protein
MDGSAHVSLEGSVWWFSVNAFVDHNEAPEDDCYDEHRGSVRWHDPLPQPNPLPQRVANHTTNTSIARSIRTTNAIAHLPLKSTDCLFDFFSNGAAVKAVLAT